MQASLAFPQSLTERYRPAKIAEFAGLDKPKRILGNFARGARSDAFVFIGPSGTGKTTMALALAAELGAELHHVGSQECTVAELEHVIHMCQYVPLRGGFHFILIDEADQMTDKAQLFLLSRLDATAFPPATIFVFTCNDTSRLEARFLSRCKVLEFSSYGLSAPLVELLGRVWHAEGGNGDAPNFARLIKESNNNARESLQRLEIALLDR